MATIWWSAVARPEGEESLTPKALAERRSRGLQLLERPPAAPAARVSVQSTFCVDLFAPLLAEALARWDRPASEIVVGPFGQVAQQLLLESSELYAAEPDVLLLVLSVEDLLEPLFAPVSSGLPDAAAAALVERRVQELRGWLGVALGRLPRTTCCVTLVGPCGAPVEHVLGPLAPERGLGAVLRLHEGVRGLAELSSRIVVVDWEWHVRAQGVASLHDPRLWYLARMRLNPRGLATLAELVAGHLAAERGAAYKVAAVDLDGVLWGGVIGEVGPGGIELGEEGLGLAFQDFQRELLRLRELGVLLVACSKNNPEDVAAVFSEHPAMVLRREHFAAQRVNWQDKATNLSELAKELNVGLDSFVFFDDSLVERAWVRQALPEVAVAELPPDPVARPGMLRSCPYFRRIVLTDVDRGRAGAYAGEHRRRDLAAGSTSFEQFLASLDQRARIEPVSDATLARAAQLCQRTNQFNLTSKRYGIAELEAMLGDGSTELYTLSVSDTFGDSGITGLTILRLGDQEAEIDTLLMSCRVLGRRLEEVLLAFLAERALALGARFLVGRFIPTARNAQVADIYPAHGFEPTGAGSFRLDVKRHRPAAPPEAQVRIVADV
ncbi:MAG TPA: HAD-IIIC family phosphatase [Solirubrobacteraceae bacterium]|jgi:FkbH-like protein|nr:HAD-IIIC family phosphatase [Solirubrobacteraceae bacterium]